MLQASSEYFTTLFSSFFSKNGGKYFKDTFKDPHLPSLWGFHPLTTTVPSFLAEVPPEPLLHYFVGCLCLTLLWLRLSFLHSSANLGLEPYIPTKMYASFSGARQHRATSFLTFDILVGHDWFSLYSSEISATGLPPGPIAPHGSRKMVCPASFPTLRCPVRSNLPASSSLSSTKAFMLPLKAFFVMLIFTSPIWLSPKFYFRASLIASSFVVSSRSRISTFLLPLQLSP